MAAEARGDPIWRLPRVRRESTRMIAAYSSSPPSRWLWIILLLGAIGVTAGIVIAIVAIVRWAASPRGEPPRLPRRAQRRAAHEIENRPTMMTRRLFNLLTALSLLLCVASLGFFLRSLGVKDRIDVESVTPEGLKIHWVVLASAGGVAVQRSSYLVAFDTPMPEPRWRLVRRSEPIGATPSFSRWRDAGYTAWGASYDSNHLATLPIWLLALIFSVFPAIRVYSRRPKRPAGLCPSCGYDLTGNVSGTCPECGAPAGRASA
jgi:hypothetical protein